MIDMISSVEEVLGRQPAAPAAAEGQHLPRRRGSGGAIYIYIYIYVCSNNYINNNNKSHIGYIENNL